MQKAIVFGTGKLYALKADYIKKNFNIEAFLDNSVEDVCYKEDIPVHNPKNVIQLLENNTNVKIILMSYQYVEMWKQLKKFGVSGQQIIFGIMFLPQTQNEHLLFSDEKYLAVENDQVVYCVNAHEKIVVDNHIQVQEFAKEHLRKEYRNKYSVINSICQMDTVPVSREFGLERGKAIDRYYIEHFLEDNSDLIRGNCIEIAENTYTLRYGGNQVKNAEVLHVEGWGDNVIKGNLETGEGIPKEKYDCAIITQTLMFIFDIKHAAENIYGMLNTGGNALITVSGISQISRYDADLWGSYYSFYEDALNKLFIPLFGKANVKIETYGNVKTACAMLCGLCQEDLVEEDFKTVDRDYPVIISAVLTKK